jgi:CheY-like chemotaxis protein
MSDLLAFELAIGESNPGAVIEGASVGYKWFDCRRLEPLFPFGHGLSYSRFDLSNLGASVDDKRLSIRFAVRNAGDRASKYVAQVYVSPIGGAAAIGWEAPKHLCGFKKVSLQPGERVDVSLSIEPRTLAVYDDVGKSWLIEDGDYDIALSTDSRNAVAHTKVHTSRQILPEHPQNLEKTMTCQAQCFAARWMVRRADDLAMLMKLRVYLVDDEALALERLTRLLEASGRVEIIGKAIEPEEAIAALASDLPDVCFLDIQMPRFNGFEVLARLPRQPIVVFTTAHDRYALDAFAVNSVDYLLKPIEPQH